MDIRELVRSHPDTVVGHKPVIETLNVKKEIRRFSKDPLEILLDNIQDMSPSFIIDDVGRYRQAYSWYKLCLKRCLEHISIARRIDSAVRYHPRNKKYTQRHKQIVERYKIIGPYLELDYQNLIIHTCILLDRTIGLSRRFLKAKNLPSFTSFNKHLTFFKRNHGVLEEYNEYEKNIIKCRNWYEVPVKVLRDKYLMHSSEKHMPFFSWGESLWDLDMLTVIPARLGQEKIFQKVKVISFSARRLARDLEQFLKWFSTYGAERITK